MNELIYYLTYCRSCGNVAEIETVATEWLDGKPTAWENRCAACGHVFGFMLDGGTLDLGMVKENITQNVNNFEVFTEESRRT